MEQQKQPSEGLVAGALLLTFGVLGATLALVGLRRAPPASQPAPAPARLPSPFEGPKARTMVGAPAPPSIPAAASKADRAAAVRQLRAGAAELEAAGRREGLQNWLEAARAVRALAAFVKSGDLAPSGLSLEPDARRAAESWLEDLKAHGVVKTYGGMPVPVDGAEDHRMPYIEHAAELPGGGGW